MSKGRGKQKGNSFEREICVLLSKWWTGGKRDDIFWRTSNSGGRATVRNKAGKKTKNQYGDICAVDPIGKPLLDLVTIEVKRGYGRATLFELIDKPNKAKKQVYEEWIKQAENSAVGCGLTTNDWWIIHKRDRRETMLYMPYSRAVDFELSREITIEVRLDSIYVGIPFKDALSIMSPKELIGLALAHYITE